MAKFGYEIEAKDKSRAGVEEAKRNLTGLGDVGKKVGGLLAAAFAGFTLAKIAGEIKKAVDLFGQQEKAEIRLAAAARNNPMLNGEAVRSLKAYASQLQSTSIYGDELIIQQEAFLATLGLSEDQIRKVISAAVDLSSTGMISLEGATRNIAKTFAGMTGELGELIPGLKTLSAEQLKAGEAVNYLSKAYGGMAQAAAQGVSGAIEQTKNLIGDMRESIGAAIAPIVLSVTQAVQPIVQKLTDWIVDHQKQIANVFLNLPDIAKIVFQGIVDMIKQVFTMDFWIEYLTALGKMWIEMFKAAFQAVWAVVKGAALIIWEPLKTGFDWVVYGIKLGINAIIEALNSALAAAHDVLQAIQHPFKPEKRTAFAGGVGPLAAEKPAPVDVAAMTRAMQAAGGGVWDALKTAGSGLLTFVTDVGQIFAPIGLQIKEGIGEVLNRELATNVRSPVEALTAAVEQGRGGALVPSAGTAGIGDRGEAQFSGMQRLFMLLSGVIGPLVTMFGGLLKSLSSVQMVLQPINTIFTAMFAVLKPVIDSILTPIIGLLTILGRTLGMILVPIFKILGPILEIVARAFLWFYNFAIVPLGNMIIWIVVQINNFVATIVNAILSLLDAIPFVNIKYRMPKMDYEEMRLEKISWEDVTSAGGEAIAGTEGSTAAGANYTAGRDINVTVNIYTGAIAGDGGFRQLSLMIRDEIYAAESLGY